MNTRYDRIAQHLNSLTYFELARYAGCLDPNTSDSAGAHFLRLVRDSVVQEWDTLTETRDPDAGGTATEIAQGCVPTHTGKRWAAFVDLGAYREDVTELGPIKTLNDAAKEALYLIATRLVYALVDEGRDLDNTEEDEEARHA